MKHKKIGNQCLFHFEVEFDIVCNYKSTGNCIIRAGTTQAQTYKLNDTILAYEYNVIDLVNKWIDTKKEEVCKKCLSNLQGRLYDKKDFVFSDPDCTRAEIVVIKKIL